MKPEPTEPSAGHRVPFAKRIEYRSERARQRFRLLLFAIAFVASSAAPLALTVLFANPWWQPGFNWLRVSIAWTESQYALLAIWLALGGGNAAQRIALAIVVGCSMHLANAYAFRTLYGTSELLGWQSTILTLVFNVLPIAVPLAWLRWTRRIRVTTARNSAQSQRRQSTQFTLAQCLLTITAIGVALGLPRLLGNFGWGLTHVIALTALMLTTLWAMLGVGRLGVRLAILGGVALVIGGCWEGFGIYSIKSIRPESDWMSAVKAAWDAGYVLAFGGLQLLATAMLAAVLGVVRRIGYRLEWLDRSEAKRLASSEESGPTSTGLAAAGPTSTGPAAADPATAGPAAKDAAPTGPATTG